MTTQEKTLAAVDPSTSVSMNLADLKKDTKYYVRAVARNQKGTVFGDMETFTTKK